MFSSSWNWNGNRKGMKRWLMQPQILKQINIGASNGNPSTLVSPMSMVFVLVLGIPWVIIMVMSGCYLWLMKPQMGVIQSWSQQWQSKQPQFPPYKPRINPYKWHGLAHTSAKRKPITQRDDPYKLQALPNSFPWWSINTCVNCWPCIQQYQ